MRNSYFAFKKFKVEQSQTQMKVTTEGALLGAVLETTGRGRLLDIGTGTGLLALMAAQKNEYVDIVGIEKDPKAAEQARQNWVESGFKNEFQVVVQSAVEYATERKFDWVVANPPFFQNSLKPNAPYTALHVEDLTIQAVAHCIDTVSTEGAAALVLYPPNEMEAFASEMTQRNWYLAEQTEVYDQSTKPKLRDICLFKRGVGAKIGKKIVIKEDGGLDYSNQFKTLLKDFYLNF